MLNSALQVLLLLKLAGNLHCAGYPQLLVGNDIHSPWSVENSTITVPDR